MGNSASAEFCKSKNLQIGDLIEYQKSKTSMSHWAIFVGQRPEKNNKHCVIHAVPQSLSKSGGNSSFSSTKDGEAAMEAMRKHHYESDILSLRYKMQCTAKICLDVIEEVPYFKDARVNNDQDKFHCPLPSNEIEGEALKAINTSTIFHTIANNCEHFANKCRYGVKLSNQSLNFVSAHPEVVDKWCEDDKLLDEYMKEIFSHKRRREKEDSKKLESETSSTDSEKEKVHLSQETVESIIADYLKKNSAESLIHKEDTEVKHNQEAVTSTVADLSKNCTENLVDTEKEKEMIKVTTSSRENLMQMNSAAKKENQHCVSDDVELKDRSLRKLNIMLYGLPEKLQDSWADDVLDVTKLIEELDLKDELQIPEHVTSIKRLGKYNPPQVRPLKIRFNVLESRDLFCQSARALMRHFPQYMNVRVRDDLTKKQRDYIVMKRKIY